MELIPPLRNAVQYIVRAEYEKYWSILSSLGCEYNSTLRCILDQIQP